MNVRSLSSSRRSNTFQTKSLCGQKSPACTCSAAAGPKRWPPSPGAWRLHLAREYRVAERVLRLALEIDPGDADTIALLARTLRRSGRRAEAIQLLEGLAAREEGGRRTAVQRLLFWVQPTPRRLWEWLRSGLGRG